MAELVTCKYFRQITSRLDLTHMRLETVSSSALLIGCFISLIEVSPNHQKRYESRESKVSFQFVRRPIAEDDFSLLADTLFVKCNDTPQSNLKFVCFSNYILTVRRNTESEYSHRFLGNAERHFLRHLPYLFSFHYQPSGEVR